MDKFKAGLKKAWDENPIAVIMVGGAAVVAVAKLIDSASGVRSRNAYARRMNYNQGNR